MANSAELDRWLETRWKPAHSRPAASKELSGPRPDAAIQVRDSLRQRLEQFQALQREALRLQNEVVDSVRNLRDTCDQLRGDVTASALQRRSAPAESPE